MSRTARAQLDSWRGVEAKRESLWNSADATSRYITTSTVQHPINSAQKPKTACWFLRVSTKSTMFRWIRNLSQDDGDKIIDFGDNTFGVEGRVLFILFAATPQTNRIADELLRWHFRQSVLVNMKGIGEPIWEHDFPDGSDMRAEILEGPLAAERMELELFFSCYPRKQNPSTNSNLRFDCSFGAVVFGNARINRSTRPDSNDTVLCSDVDRVLFTLWSDGMTCTERHLDRRRSFLASR